MKIIKITCPFCDFMKEIPDFPLKAIKATCPKCHKSFDLHGNWAAIGKEGQIEDYIYCPKCGYSNDKSHAICCACGNILDKANKLNTGVGCLFFFIVFMSVILVFAYSMVMNFN